MFNKIWFITGVSTGLGRDLAEQVAKTGAIVIGTVRKQEQVQAFNELVEGFTFAEILDVNDHAKVHQVIHKIVEKHGKIDVLVNNAGYGLCGSIEEVTMNEAREQMETNFFGALAVTQAVLPFMRKQKSGHIIQVSSIAGHLSAPGLGIYNASKFALEGFSEALYSEVAPLGIKVTLVEPGPFKTKWAGASMKFAQKTIEDYIPTAGRVKDFLHKVDGNQAGDPKKAALAVMQVVNSATPPLRLALGKQALINIKKKIDWVAKDLHDWEAVTAGADFE